MTETESKSNFRLHQQKKQTKIATFYCVVSEQFVLLHRFTFLWESLALDVQTLCEHFWKQAI